MNSRALIDETPEECLSLRVGAAGEGITRKYFYLAFVAERVRKVGYVTECMFATKNSLIPRGACSWFFSFVLSLKSDAINLIHNRLPARIKKFYLHQTNIKYLSFSLTRWLGSVWRILQALRALVWL